MRKRVAMLAGLLVLVLLSGAVAQEPSPTPLYAPDDLASLLPSSIGEVELDLVEIDGEGLRDHPVYGDGLRELLLPLGKEPADVRYAQATSDGGLSVGIFAVRIAGIDPQPLQVDLVGIFLFGEGLSDLVAIEPTTVDGRAVNLLTGGVMSLNGYTFTIGEVFFYVDVSPDAPVTIEDVLAEMP